MLTVGKLFRVLMLPLGLAAVGVMRLIAPLYLIRLGELWSSRVGHFGGNTELLRLEVAAGLHPRGWFGGREFYCLQPVVCNAYLARMWSRVLPIDRSGVVRYLRVINRALQGWERFEVEPRQWDRDIHNLLERYPAALSFTAAERVRGEAALRAMGIPEGAKWVCLIQRDGAYLGRAGAYHKHRDSRIATYRRAVRALVKRGYYVVRMGVLQEEYLGMDGPRNRMVIDYAMNGMRTDFMDLYLGAHCAFCLSNGCGFDAIPMIFRRPVCYVNYVPLEYIPTWMAGLVIWKHHYRRGKRMTPGEIFESGAGLFMRAEEYRQAGIRVRANTPEEIEAVAVEMAERCETGGDVYSDQHRFWAKYPRTIAIANGQPLHGEVRIRVGAEFLRTYMGGTDV